MNSRKNRTCKKYRSCNHVPCGAIMKGCRPKYCTRGSMSWGNANQSLQKTCKISRRKTISNDQVYATELHKKMPYIWRFLGNKTRRKMIHLARKPIREINIPYMKH